MQSASARMHELLSGDIAKKDTHRNSPFLGVVRTLYQFVVCRVFFLPRLVRITSQRRLQGERRNG